MGWDNSSPPGVTKRARELRKSLTRQEAQLWLQLRAMRSDGFHFRRQAPLLGFYLDFACFKHRLVVEIDGSQHGEDVQADHDAMRDAILRRTGFRMLRFWNSDIDANLDGVVVTIQQALSNPPSPLWGGTADPKDRQGGGVGRVNDAFLSPRTAPESPTLAASRPVPPHKGEGGK
jgi:very-short-patch-repair endonuclease